MNARKTIGRIKAYFIDYLPYVPLERRSRRMAIALAPQICQFSRLSTPLSIEAEVSMLCCHRDIFMGIAASWSLLRYLPTCGLVVHDDGTMTREDQEKWRTVIPFVRFTSRLERDAIIENEIRAQFPRLFEWRSRHVYGAKLVDFHLLTSAKKIISLDSDVLTFSHPAELQHAIKSDDPVLRWQSDVVQSYIAPAETLQKALRSNLPERVNTGFLLASRWSRDDLEHLDSAIAQLENAGLDINHFWAEQTLYAMMAKRRANSRALGPQYDVYFGRTKEESAVRHYVGGIRIRPRFYLEGIPRILGSQTAVK